jgi:hypothetical protein
MLKRFFKPLLCSVFLAGQMIHAQEVVVPHETKPEPPEQAAPSSESEQTPSESAAPTRTKPKPREKKSVAPTLDQMRAAGAHAAVGQNERSVSQPSRTGASHSETAAAPSPVVSATATPVKRETQVEQKSASRTPRPRGTKLEPIGPVRPTIIESGREQPTATPTTKAAARDEQVPAP